MADSNDFMYESLPDPYVYPGTTILKNKFDIRDAKILSTLERQITETKTLLLSREGSDILEGNFDLKHLQTIHRHLFSDIYDWAGELRKIDYIGKGKTVFCSASLIETYANSIFSKIRLEPFSQMLRNECAKKMAYYLLEVNALYPFRAGNVRAILVFFEALAFRHGWQLRVFRVPLKELRKAMTKRNDDSLRELSRMLQFFMYKIADFE